MSRHDGRQVRVVTYFVIFLGVNATPVQPPPHEVRFLLQSGGETEAATGLTLTASSVPMLSKHPLGMSETDMHNVLFNNQHSVGNTEGFTFIYSYAEQDAMVKI